MNHKTFVLADCPHLKLVSERKIQEQLVLDDKVNLGDEPYTISFYQGKYLN